MLELNKKNLFLVVATSALLTVWVNETILAEPEEMQEDHPEFLSGVDNVTDVNFGNLSKFTEQNATLVSNDESKYKKYPNVEYAILKYPPYNENITRVLTLQINFSTENGGTFDLEDLIKNGYYINALIKSDRYVDFKKFSFADIVFNKHKLPILIIDNGTNKPDFGKFQKRSEYKTHYNEDDGGDFRIDVWVNNFDDRFEKATYPISRNATFDSVDITELIKYVWQDNEKEGNHLDSEGMSNINNGEEEENEDAKYS